MRRTNIVIQHILLWVITWLVLAAIMYTVQYILFIEQNYTYWKCIIDPFTVYSQLLMGSFIVYYVLENKRRKFIV